jgi:hypothetical protein
MMSLCHGWGWQPPQTASHIHTRHIQNVWVHWYAVHCHRVAALYSFTHSNWIRLWDSGSLEESKWCHYVMVEADCHLKLLPTSILDISKNGWAHWYAVHGHTVAALHRYPPYLAQILGLWVTCGVKMMSLCHGWGWLPPQTASFILSRHIQNDWVHWYAVHGHTVAALHSYTHPTWLRFWGSGSLVESKWCHHVTVESDSHLKLLPTSI